LIHKTWISVSAAFRASAEGMGDRFPESATTPAPPESTLGPPV
jgi:hypothetical protein